MCAKMYTNAYKNIIIHFESSAGDENEQILTLVVEQYKKIMILTRKFLLLYSREGLELG